MEGRPPFDPDDLDFDFETPRRRAHERETGERPIQPGPEEPGSSEYATEPPAEPPAAAPYDTGESDYGTGDAPAPDTTGERAYDTGEDPFDTGTGEPAYDTGEDPFDTGERRRRPREKKRGLRLRLPGRGRGGRRERGAALDTGERAALQDDPYTPAEVAVAGTRRSRHRDLPANVRRRQAGLAGFVVLAVLVGIFLLVRSVFGGGGGGGDGDEPLAIKKLVGQTIIGKLPRDGPNPELIRRVKKGQLGGVIATTPDAAELAGYVSQLQKAAEAGDNPPLLVMVDQEGGEVKRFPEGPPTAAPADLGETNDAEAAQQEGADTAEFLKTAGVNVDLAPVLDVRLDQTADTIADRTFSDDPAVVASVGSAFIDGLQSGGVAATGKHFPGMGPAATNTDFAVVTVAASQETLDEALVPFQAAIDSGVGLMMISSANYTDYGPENPRDPNKPANQVKAIVQSLLREQMGFGGVVITDDLEAVAIDEIENTATAGVKALGAGCDLILYAGSVRGSEDALAAAAKAVKKGSLARAEVQASYDRIQDLKNSLGSGSE